jgi:hypothetical protein
MKTGVFSNTVIEAHSVRAPRLWNAWFRIDTIWNYNSLDGLPKDGVLLIRRHPKVRNQIKGPCQRSREGVCEKDKVRLFCGILQPYKRTSIGERWLAGWNRSRGPGMALTFQCWWISQFRIALRLGKCPEYSRKSVGNIEVVFKVLDEEPVIPCCKCY